MNIVNQATAIDFLVSAFLTEALIGTGSSIASPISLGLLLARYSIAAAGSPKQLNKIALTSAGVQRSFGISCSVSGHSSS